MASRHDERIAAAGPERAGASFPEIARAARPNVRFQRRPRILIASASAGSGHVRAAEALHRTLEASAETSTVEHVDVLRLAPRWVRAAYGSGFELVATRAPWVWREIYRRTDGPGHDTAVWGPVVERVLFRAFHRLLRHGGWDYCVCTHFLPGQLAAGLPGLPPFALVVTDFTLHRYWVQPRVDRYFVATATLAAELRERCPGARVSVTGIPVAAGFSEPPSRDEARRALRLDPDRPVAVIAGGGFGLGVEETAMVAVASGRPDLQVVALCGRNEGARERLTELGVPADRLVVVGYTHLVDHYVAAADVVVTKPGGLTCSEALALSKPILLTRPVPGHEEANARLLIGTGAALDARRPALLATALTRAFSEPSLLGRMATAAETLGRPHAASAIACSILAELEAGTAARHVG